MGTWGEVLAYAGTVVLGIITNFCVAAYYAGKYKERVERLTFEVRGYEKDNHELNTRIQKLERQFAAFTGHSNGYTREEN